MIKTENIVIYGVPCVITVFYITYKFNISIYVSSICSFFIQYTSKYGTEEIQQFTCLLKRFYQNVLGWFRDVMLPKALITQMCGLVVKILLYHRMQNN